MSSFGPGTADVTLAEWEIRTAFFEAGRLRHFAAGGTSGFEAYGLGTTDMDLPRFFDWSARDYDVTRLAFKAPSTRFVALYRSFDGGPIDSGAANHHGILLYLAPHHSQAGYVSYLKFLMAHEVVHVFQPYLDDNMDRTWFIEGSAQYLGKRIPFDAGLISAEDYLIAINQTAIAYYTLPTRNIGNDALEDTMWSFPAGWMQPYERGALYFADLDARVRARSAGKVTLITLLNAFGALDRLNLPHGSKAWRDLVVRNAGVEGGRRYDEMLAGRTIIPIAGAFGRCFVASASAPGRFDLQYAKDADNMIVAVTPNSNAARAGLRVSDKLVGNADINFSVRSVDTPVELPIMRDGKRMTIT